MSSSGVTEREVRLNTHSASSWLPADPPGDDHPLAVGTSVGVPPDGSGVDAVRGEPRVDGVAEHDDPALDRPLLRRAGPAGLVGDALALPDHRSGEAHDPVQRHA